MTRIINIYPADILSRPKLGNPLITHYSMALGYNNKGQFEVIENTDIYGVRIILLDEFKQGSASLVVESAGINVDRERRIQVAKSYLGQPYSLLTFNCEHFVNLIKSGKPHSSQVFGFGLLALTTVGLALASKRFNN